MSATPLNTAAQPAASAPASPGRRRPQRSCVVCRQRRDKRELTRIALGADGTSAVIDSAARAPGRGAYLCESTACWEQAASGGALLHALRATINEHGLDVIRNEARRLADADSIAVTEPPSEAGGVPHP